MNKKLGFLRLHIFQINKKFKLLIRTPLRNRSHIRKFINMSIRSADGIVKRKNIGEGKYLVTLSLIGDKSYRKPEYIFKRVVRGGGGYCELLV